MTEYTEEQIAEQVREAVERTEKSFGGTFKRLKGENEELRARLESFAGERDAERDGFSRRIAELEHEVAERGGAVAELTVRGEIERQMRETGVLPDEFVDPGAIAYDDDPDTLRANVASELARGRGRLERALRELGVQPPDTAPANPTNPPLRGTAVSRAVARTASRNALSDMVRRGMIH